MENETNEDIKSINNLSRTLGGFDQGEIGWLYSATRHAPTYQDSALNESIQKRLDHAVSGLSIVYMFALFETYFPKRKWKKYVAPKILNELLAYRHIRHSVAHGFNGERARDHSEEFEWLVNTSRPQCIEDWGNDSLLLNEYGYKDLKPIMEKAISSALNSLYNSKYYV